MISNTKSEFFITSMSASKKNRKICISGYDEKSYNNELEKIEYIEENEEQLTLRAAQIFAHLISGRLKVKSANDYKIYLAYNETDELLKSEWSDQIQDLISEKKASYKNSPNTIDFFLDNCKIEFKLIAGELFLAQMAAKRPQKGKYILRGVNHNGRRVSLNKSGKKVSCLNDFEMTYGLANYLLNEICPGIFGYEWAIEPIKEN